VTENSLCSSHQIYSTKFASLPARQAQHAKQLTFLDFTIILAIIQRPLHLFQKYFKAIFWFGYTVTLLVAFLPLAGDLSKTKVNALVFEIRLDHLLHFAAYLLICLYYLAGKFLGYRLFKSKPLLKFLLAVLLLATVTEVVQLWVPARAFNPFDLVANVGGLAAGVGLILLGGRRLRSQEPSLPAGMSI
jgi:VanZ family protein